ncbi:MAG: hypothetical protein ACREK7_02120 [Gemmatimonadota bacterium]
MKLMEAAVKEATARGKGRVLGLAGCVTAVLYNGLGRYEAALAGAQRGCDHEELGFFKTTGVYAASRATVLGRSGNGHGRG